MPINYYCGINLNQTTLGKPVIDPQATPPDVGTEVDGQMYFDNAGAGAGNMYFWDGTGWVSMSGGVTSVLIGNAAVNSAGVNAGLTISGASGAVTFTPKIYGGGANVGFVPTGGANTTFLRGDGVFATPAGGGTMSSWRAAADSGTTQAVADGNTVNFIGDTNGGISTKVDTSVSNQAVLFQLDVNDLSTLASPATGDFIPLADISDSGNTKKATIASILALAPQGDVTEVSASTTNAQLGIKIQNPTGPIPVVGFDIIGRANLAATPANDDELMIYDLSTTTNKSITVANLMAAAPQGDITQIIPGTGMTGTSLTGPIPTLNVIGGAGLTANADDMAVDYLGTDSIIKAAPTLSRSVATSDIILMADPTSGNVAETPLSTLPFSNNAGVVTSLSAGTFVTIGGTAAVPIVNASGTTAATASKLIARDASGFGFAITPSSGDSSTKLATTAFVQAALTGLLEFKSGFNANTGIIADGSGDDLYTDRAIAVGDYYVVTVAGNFFGNAATPLTPGDSVIVQTAEAAGSAAEADFVVVQSDTDVATLTAIGLGNVAPGAGIGVVYSNGTATVTNSDRGSAQNIFKNVAGDSGTAVADNNNDTLTIAGGANITTTVVGDVLTIAATTVTPIPARLAGTGLSLSGNTINANVDGSQSVAANTSSTTAARTYNVQVSSTDKLVVNVPWSDTSGAWTAQGETGSASVDGGTLIFSGSGIRTTVNNSGTGGTVSIDLDIDNLTAGTAATDSLLAFATSGGAERKATISSILALAPQGDVTGVSASTANDELGIKVASSTGPVPVVGLDIKGLADIGTGAASADRLAVYDVTGDVNKYATISSLAPLIRKASTFAGTINAFGTVTHGLNSFDVIVQLYNATTYETVEACVDRATVNTVAIAGSSFPAGNIRVLVSLCDQGA